MKKAQARMRWKIKDLIDELHHKAALFFVRHFDVILIPKFETSQMSRRGCRKIRAKSVRSMLTFAHYRFQEFLKFKAWEYDKIVVHVNEAYTSKTCSWNGKIKQIGGAKLTTWSCWIATTTALAAFFFAGFARSRHRLVMSDAQQTT